MTNHQSPITETNSSNSIVVFLLFALLVLGALFFFFQSAEQKSPIQESVPTAQPASPTASDAPIASIPISATINASRMNVFYIGVDNPIDITMPGVSSNDVRVSIMGGGTVIKRTGANQYVVKATKPTADCKIVVSAGGQSFTKTFRVKRIPDPVARLGKKSDGSMGNGEFKAQKGVIAWLDNFDFDAKCNIQGFELTRQPEGKTPEQIINRGGRFTEETTKLVRSAKPGDTYWFTRVKARCPGDAAGRKINSMVFKIK